MELKTILEVILKVIIALAGFGFWYLVDCLRDWHDERKRAQRLNNLERRYQWNH